MNTMTIETKTEIAMQMVIMDAMEKGHTSKDGLIEFMKSDAFKNATKRYMEMFNEA